MNGNAKGSDAAAGEVLSTWSIARTPGALWPAGGRRIAVIPEGAARPEALLGTIRLVRWLSSQSELAERECHIVVDSGTGATATGAAVLT